MARRKTTEQFKKEIYALVKDEYTLLSEYVNNKTKVRMRHNICGTDYEVKPKGFLDGNRCPPCCFKSRGARYKTQQEFEKEVFDLVGGEYIVEGTYRGATKKVTLLHKVCGGRWDVTPNAFLSVGIRCYSCARKEIGEKNRKNHDDFLAEVTAKHGEEYQLIGEYIRSTEPILVEHRPCGKRWAIRPDHLINGSCPRCKSSTGEKLTRKVLESIGTSFEEQRGFDGLVKERELTYDFYLPKEGVLIEYQGIQHYLPVSFGGSTPGEERLKDQQIRDQLKRDYAKNNGLTLIEIPYTVNTYEEIKNLLEKNLKK